jgi:hypothetical protein
MFVASNSGAWGGPSSALDPYQDVQIDSVIEQKPKKPKKEKPATVRHVNHEKVEANVNDRAPFEGVDSQDPTTKKPGHHAKVSKPSNLNDYGSISQTKTKKLPDTKFKKPAGTSKSKNNKTRRRNSRDTGFVGGAKATMHGIGSAGKQLVEMPVHGVERIFKRKPGSKNGSATK